VFRAYLKSTGRIDELGFQLGRMSMALEIITQIKALEELRAIASDLGRAEAVSALDTLLLDCGMRDVAYEMYEKLNGWRRPAFSPEPERGGISDAGAVVWPQYVHRKIESSSLPASLPVIEAPASTPSAWPVERHDLGQGADSSSASEGYSDGSVEGMLTELRGSEPDKESSSES
jgi:hypothetical protein